MQNTNKKIDVLVVADAAMAATLADVLEADPRLAVAGKANSGTQALAILREHRPALVLMNTSLPGAEVFEVTRTIMQTCPLPVVICSGMRNSVLAMRAIEAGALACVECPESASDPAEQDKAEALRDTVRLMSELKVVRRHGRREPNAMRHLPVSLRRSRMPVKIVGIGASTGGPPALQKVLAGLSKDFPVPVLVVQHIAPGFLAGMAAWLADSTGLPIHVAAAGTLPLAGHVYLAPDGKHMGLAPNGLIALNDSPPENHVRPSVSFLFRSLANVCGSSAAGVLLSGMGRDGAEQLKQLRDCGAPTIAQDLASAAVHGMPGAAIALAAAEQVLPAERIAHALVALVAPTY